MDNIAWFKKFQPKAIEDYVFDTNEQKQQALQWIENNSINGNLLLCGDAGTGKTALSTILIQNLIKSSYDLKYIKKRSVESIDKLQNWLEKKPVKSIKKIIYLEEFDRLSREAIATLKDGMMEKYQEHVTFICTTNYLNRIDKAIRTRFTYKWVFGIAVNSEGVVNRLNQILKEEDIKFSLEDLQHFVKNNAKIGMRDLINTLQINSINGTVDFTNIKLEKSEQEQQIIELTLKIFSFLFTTKDIKQKHICMISPMNSEIAAFYSGILDLTQYNLELDYESIYIELDNKINFLPITKLIDKYLNELNSKRLLHIHYISFLYDSIKTIIDIN